MISLTALIVLIILGIIFFGLCSSGFFIVKSFGVKISNKTSNVYFLMGMLMIVLMILFGILIPIRVSNGFYQNPEYKILTVYEEKTPLNIKNVMTPDSYVAKIGGYAADSYLYLDGDVLKVLPKESVPIREDAGVSEPTLKRVKVCWGKVTHKIWVFCFPAGK